MQKNGLIEQVYPGSIAAEAGIEPGDCLLKINNREISDIIDYRLASAEEKVFLLIKNKDEQYIEYEIEKDYNEDLGIRFLSPTIGQLRLCNNRCIFCFVDQMPHGLRPSLYLKDDDYRLSFLHGSFITLNNVNAEDKARIKKLHLSPLYVSVHTTDHHLRQNMMQNFGAPSILAQLKELIASGIEFHTQIVLCPGVNDGAVLEQAVNGLASLSPGILSVAIVPVGITSHRRGLPELRKVEGFSAQRLIKEVHNWQNQFKKRRGSNFVFLADEFYLLADCKPPLDSEYEGYPQLENGVGLTRLLLEQFKTWKQSLPDSAKHPVSFSLVTGEIAAPLLKEVACVLNNIKGIEARLFVIENTLFGKQVTVAGLLSGRDLIAGIESQKLGKFVVFPKIMLKSNESFFLDGLSPEDVSAVIGVPLYPAADLDELISLILSKQGTVG